jgi:hypothetical protein
MYLHGKWDFTLHWEELHAKYGADAYVSWNSKFINKKSKTKIK